HTAAVNSVAFSPEGSRLASGSGDHTVKVWDAQTGQELFTIKGQGGSVYGVAFSPDGQRLASSVDGTVKLWDAQNGQEAIALRGHKRGIRSVAFSPDGQRLASGALDSTAKVWNAQTGQALYSLEGFCFVNSVAFSPDGRRLACARGFYPFPKKQLFDDGVKIWDAQTGQELLTWNGPVPSAPFGLATVSVAFSPDGKRLASVCSSGRV